MTQHSTSRLLLDCLSYGPGGPDASRIAGLSSVEWEDLINLSKSHRVTLLLRRRLQAPQVEAGVPSEVKERLHRLYLISVARNVRLLHQTAEVVEEIRSSGIPVILLKGTHLAQVPYGDIGLRPMVDIDLLVRKADLGEVSTKLRGMGYRSFKEPRVERTSTAVHQHVPTFSKPDAASIDVHWTLVSPRAPFVVDTDGLWSRARPLPDGDSDALVLSPEDLLLHLSLHIGYTHTFCSGILGLCDIAEVVRHHGAELDWQAAQRRSRTWGASKCLYLTLRLARDLLLADVPAQVLTDLEPEDLTCELVAKARQAMDPSGGIIAERFSPGLARIMAAERWQDKLSTFFGVAFPPRDLLGGLYGVSPSGLRIFLYYPLYLQRLRRQRGDAAWRLLRGDETATASIRRRQKGVSLVEWLSAP